MRGPEATTTSVPQIRLSIMSSVASRYRVTIASTTDQWVARTHAIVLIGALNGRRDAVRLFNGLFALSPLVMLTLQQFSYLNPYAAMPAVSGIYFNPRLPLAHIHCVLLTRWHVCIQLFFCWIYHCRNMCVAEGDISCKSLDRINLGQLYILFCFHSDLERSG